MSAFDQTHGDDNNWQEVSSSRKKSKKSIKKELLIKQTTFNKKVKSNLQPSNVEIVGQYVLSMEQGIHRDADGTVRRNPPHIYQAREPGYIIRQSKGPANPLQQFPPFSTELLQSGLYNADILHDVDIVIGRGLIKKLMKVFEFNSNTFFLKDFTFHIQLLHQCIRIEDHEPWDLDSMTYGHTFEASVVSTKPEDMNTYFYRMLRYDLEELRLLVSYEVDCVWKEEDDESEDLSQCASVEVKSYQTEAKMLDYWYQLAAGDTQHLIVGKIDRSTDTVQNIQHVLLEDILDSNHEARRKRFGQVKEVLKWIKEEVLNVRTTLTDTSVITLSFDKTHPYQLFLKITL